MVVCILGSILNANDFMSPQGVEATLYRTNRRRRGPQSTSTIQRPNPSFLNKVPRNKINVELPVKVFSKFHRLPGLILAWWSRHDRTSENSYDRRDDHHGRQSFSISKILYVVCRINIKRLACPTASVHASKSFLFSSSHPLCLI